MMALELKKAFNFTFPKANNAIVWYSLFLCERSAGETLNLNMSENFENMTLVCCSNTASIILSTFSYPDQ